MQFNKNEKMLDAVLLFDGNFMPVPVLESKVEEFSNFLRNETSRPDRRWTTLGSNIWFQNERLIGFYFRPHIEKTTSEKMLDEVKKMAASTNEADSWKSNDDE